MSERRPKRIQRRRTKGWRMPAGAVYVGRPTKWGNPWRLDLAHNYFGRGPLRTPEEVRDGRELCTDFFRRETLTPQICDMARAELRGKDLCCWCSLDQPCHADVLLEIANTEEGVE